MSGFYIDADKATRRDLIGRIKVTLNGRPLKLVVAAKSGRNGFVEFFVRPLTIRGDAFVTKKLRGNVKVTLSPATAGRSKS